MWKKIEITALEQRESREKGNRRKNTHTQLKFREKEEEAAAKKKRQ